MSGGTVGQFKYAALASPVTLAPYTTYYIASRESNGLDQWYSYDNVLTTTSAATINHMAYASTAAPNTFIDGSYAGGMWGPLSFRYETDWNLASETRYIYDGMLAIQERDGNNVPRVTYTRGLDLSGSLQGAGGIGGLLARTDHSSLTPYHAFYHADGSGNITALINTNQVVVARYHYDPFGNTLAKSGPLAEANTMRFSSKPIHPPSGMYDFARRWYEPNLQRWLNQDPIEEAGGINLYAFAGNSGLNRIDPFGEVAPLLVFCAAIAADYAVEKGLDYVGNNWIPEEQQGTFQTVRNAYDAASTVASVGKAGRKMAGEAVDVAKGAVNRVRTALENRAARNFFKNNKDKARKAWEQRLDGSGRQMQTVSLGPRSIRHH
jgi:RHS repeat-associated protein